jgi:hypothetical protein
MGKRRTHACNRRSMSQCDRECVYVGVPGHSGSSVYVGASRWPQSAPHQQRHAAEPENWAGVGPSSIVRGAVSGMLGCKETADFHFVTSESWTRPTERLAPHFNIRSRWSPLTVS